MRYVSSIPPMPSSPDTRLVVGLTAINVVRPVRARDPELPQAGQNTLRHDEIHSTNQQGQDNVPFEERRKLCRRVSHQHVLVELRSGVDRRKHNLRGEGPAEHIDEEA
jgi:hypothetical protein